MIKTIAMVMLFTGLAAAQEPNVFSVRSFLNPDTQAKIQMDGKLLSSPEDLKALAQALVVAQVPGHQCAIALAEAKAPKMNDKMPKLPVAPHIDPKSVIKPPVPACR